MILRNELNFAPYQSIWDWKRQTKDLRKHCDWMRDVAGKSLRRGLNADSILQRMCKNTSNNLRHTKAFAKPGINCPISFCEVQRRSRLQLSII